MNQLNSEEEKIVNGILQDMRRGTIVLAVLTQMDNPQYGYSLIEALKERQFEIDQNTLYPLMRRLEKQGLLQSDWEVTENRPRRYYQISDFGKTVRQILIDNWKQTMATMAKLIEKEE